MESSTITEFKSRIAFWEDVFEGLPIGAIILDKQGTILLMNRYQERISRVTRDQVLGKLFHEAWKKLFEQNIYGNNYWNLLKNDKPFTFIYHGVMPQFYDVKISGISQGAPLPSGSGFVLLHSISNEVQRDKIALEQLAKQLTESSEFLTNLVDSSPNVVISVSRDGFIQSSNKTAETLFGYTKGDLHWLHISHLFRYQIRYQIDMDTLAKESYPGKAVEFECRKKSGGFFPVRLQVCDIKNADGKINSKLLIITDITHEKAMEEKLRLSEKLAIFSELMAGIAHQVNNPLVGVINFSNLLISRMPDDDPNRELAQTIYQAGQRCLQLLNSMMKSIHTPENDFHLTDVSEVLDSAISAVSNPVQPTGPPVEIIKDLSKNLPEIMGNALQLREVFRNILTNALQAMPNGGVLNVRIAVNDPEKEVQIRFADTGIGISKEDLSKIFTPFYTTKTNTGGGLGLSFAYQVIKSHSGRISVRSELNKGTTFIVILPFKQ